MARAKVGDERREQILSAFEKCVILKGLAKTTLQDVAKEAELPRSLVRYFVGNRADMVDLIIDRMIERAERDLLAQLHENKKPNFEEYLDFVLSTVFANETSNAIISELWYLSENNSSIKTRLAELYSAIRDGLVEQMKREAIGKNIRDRRAFSQLIMSLAYGNASFEYLGLNIPSSNKNVLVNSLMKTL